MLSDAFHFTIMKDLSIEKVKRSGINNPRFSILIPSWNNLGYLRLCIAALRKNSHFGHQIIIHVNEGSDGTIDWLKTQPDVDYSYSKKNIGVCLALNIARSLSA